MSDERQTAQPVDLASLSVEGVDLAEGVRLYRDSYPEILRCYCRDVDDQLSLVNELCKKGCLDGEDLKKYAIAVHGIKGASFGIQAGGMGKIAEYMEHTAKAGDAAAILANNSRFAEKAAGLVVSLKELLKQVEVQSQKEKASAPDKELLKKIADACGSFKLHDMEQALAEMEKYEYESGGELVAWLREQIDNLEYDKIREKILSL